MKRMWSKNELKQQSINLLGSGQVPSIKGGEIIENMSGYSFNKGSETENLTKDFIYAGVCKNGNKITFVVACNLTRTAELLASPTLGYFTLPKAVADRIISSTIATYEYVTVDERPAWANDSTNKLLQIYSYKTGQDNKNIRMDMNRAPINLLTANLKYYFRYEFTVLLSENLIS